MGLISYVGVEGMAVNVESGNEVLAAIDMVHSQMMDQGLDQTDAELFKEVEALINKGYDLGYSPEPF